MGVALPDLFTAGQQERTELAVMGDLNEGQFGVLSRQDA